MFFGIEIEFCLLQHRSAVDVVGGVLGVGLKFHTELLTLGFKKKKKKITFFTFLFFGIEIEFCLLQHRGAVDVVGGVLGIGLKIHTELLTLGFKKKKNILPSCFLV